MTPFKVAVVQASPILFDKTASTEKACRLIAEAGRTGARLAAFGEAWIAGHPFFIFSPPADPVHWSAMADFLANAIAIPGPETDLLCAAARDADIDVVIGATELAPSGGSAFCTLIFIGREGRILGRHRKLNPTHAERIAWADGDASGLEVHHRDYARISGLNCWEHAMVLPGYALMAGGTQLHVSAWPGTEHDNPAPEQRFVSKMHLLSRAFAAQAGCYVLAVGGLRRPEDIPERYAGLANIWPNTGDSCVIDPRGEIIAGPAQGETILVAEIAPEAVLTAKAACDVGGHYARTDLFRLTVDRSERKPLSGLED